MTHVVVPVYRLLRAAGRLLFGGLLCGVWVLCEWVSGMTHVVVPVYRLLRAAGRLLFGGLLCGVWVLCENWIVDASILFFCKFDFVKQFFCL
ncbi:hypothetical protein [Corynebacterium sp. HFH0082]|uniref:hypothetical protein n=1 Tax=Corynebacterium sp. HFH0082 TaxID=1078764 RepID=UPI0011C9D24B|nr:hypothetical protein [Corynebacterium sp. HFH0082]